MKLPEAVCGVGIRVNGDWSYKASISHYSDLIDREDVDLGVKLELASLIERCREALRTLHSAGCFDEGLIAPIDFLESSESYLPLAGPASFWPR